MEFFWIFKIWKILFLHVALVWMYGIVIIDGLLPGTSNDVDRVNKGLYEYDS